MRTTLIILVTCLWLMVGGRPADAEPVAKKFIQLGWDIPNTTFLREHAQEMEAAAPFDGVMFKVEVKDDEGQVRSSAAAWDTQAWKREWLASALSDLQNSQFTKFTDNFLRINASPGNLDWSDDASWDALAKKMGMFAWLAKQGSIKGLVLDFESYGERQFYFRPRPDWSFATAAAFARRRGAAVMRGIASEFPDAVVLGLWLNSANFKAGESEDPEEILKRGRYGLLPAFINGLLDALPPSMILVDGCEFGYYYDGAEEYQRAAAKIRSQDGPSARLVAPENRDKWQTQVKAGFGFYLDMYLNSPGNRFYFGPKPGGTRLDRLRENLAAAHAAADQYVWLFGEQSRWWNVDYPPTVSETVKRSVGQGRRWEDALPGLTATITNIKTGK